MPMVWFFLPPTAKKLAFKPRDIKRMKTSLKTQIIPYTTSQCLRYIKASPNIDFECKLQQKYQQRHDAELIIAKQQ